MDNTTNTNKEQILLEDNKPFSERHHHFILSILLIAGIIAGGWYVITYKPWGIGGSQKQEEQVIPQDESDINTIDTNLQEIDIETLPQ